MDVIVVAAPKDLVQSRIQVLENLGIDVESVDIEAFSTDTAYASNRVYALWAEGVTTLDEVDHVAGMG